MGLMPSGPAALDGPRPASSFKIPASDISIWGISGTLGLNVPGMFSSLREPLTSPSSMVFSETPAPNIKSTRATREFQYTRYFVYSEALKNSFFPRTISVWNSLPSSVVSSKTPEEFKALI